MTLKIVPEDELVNAVGTKLKIKLHIPAHREHPFWFKVNTYSGGT